MKKSNYDAYVEVKFLLENPFKLRKVANTIRKKPVLYSLQLLKTMPQRGAEVIYKALHSVYSNAKCKNLSENNLIVESIIIDEGARHKRFQARARGRGFQILKRSSHIKIGLKSTEGEKNGSKSSS